VFVVPRTSHKLAIIIICNISTTHSAPLEQFITSTCCFEQCPQFSLAAPKGGKRQIRLSVRTLAWGGRVEKPKNRPPARRTNRPLQQNLLRQNHHRRRSQQIITPQYPSRHQMWLRGGHPLRLLSLIAPLLLLSITHHLPAAHSLPQKRLSGEHTTPVLPGAVPTPQERNLHYTLWRGGKQVLARVNNPSMGVALSSSNPIYQDHYGSPDSEHQEDLYDGDSDRDYSSR
jgi:hypothetical protein